MILMPRLFPAPGRLDQRHLLKELGRAADDALDQAQHGRMAGERRQRRMPVDEAHEFPDVGGAQRRLDGGEPPALLADREAAAGAAPVDPMVGPGIEGDMVPEAALVPDHGAARIVGQRHRSELGLGCPDLACREQAADEQKAVPPVAFHPAGRCRLGRGPAGIDLGAAVERRVVGGNLRLEEDADGRRLLP